MEQIDWLDDYYEEEYTNWDKRYEAMAEKEDITYQDRNFEKMREENSG